MWRIGGGKGREVLRWVSGTGKEGEQRKDGKDWGNYEAPLFENVEDLLN